MSLTNKEWEDLCNNCGGCCNMEPTNYACPLYDCDNHRCSDYENRFDKIPDCDQLTPDNVLRYHFQGVLPEYCNYVRYVRGQPLTWPEPKQLTPFEQAPKEFKLKYYEIRKK